MRDNVNTIDKTRKGWKRYLKKLQAELNNILYVPFKSIDNMFTINPKCKLCSGLGYLGYKNNERIVCTCIKITKEYKQHLHQDLQKISKEKENNSIIKTGSFKGFKKIDEEYESEHKKIERAIDDIPTI